MLLTRLPLSADAGRSLRPLVSCSITLSCWKADFETFFSPLWGNKHRYFFSETSGLFPAVFVATKTSVFSVQCWDLRGRQETCVGTKIIKNTAEILLHRRTRWGSNMDYKERWQRERSTLTLRKASSRPRLQCKMLSRLFGNASNSSGTMSWRMETFSISNSTHPTHLKRNRESTIQLSSASESFTVCWNSAGSVRGLPGLDQNLFKWLYISDVHNCWKTRAKVPSWEPKHAQKCPPGSQNMRKVPSWSQNMC